MFSIALEYTSATDTKLVVHADAQNRHPSLNDLRVCLRLTKAGVYKYQL